MTVSKQRIRALEKSLNLNQPRYFYCEKISEKEIYIYEGQKYNGTEELMKAHGIKESDY